MSTRWSLGRRIGRDAVPLGYSGTSGERVEVPECGMEDVDRALFNLFNIELPLVYEKSAGELRRVPVIFSTGERFATTRRAEPLRDSNGALVIPVISIMRTGLSQQAEKLIEIGDVGTIDIRRRLSQDDPAYQRLLNVQGLKNTGRSWRKEGIKPQSSTVGGRLLQPNLSAGIYETISIPTPKFFTATYEITIWTQYFQQSNALLSTIVSGYHNVRARAYRIETASGYWFTATFEPEIGSDNNFDNMTDEERLIKNSFKVSVPAFIINPGSAGIPNGVRTSQSPTQFSFSVINGYDDPEPRANVDDMRINSHVLSDIETSDSQPVRAAIGSDAAAGARRRAGSPDRRGSSADESASTSLGGTESQSIKVASVTQTLTEDPITGDPIDVTYVHRSVSNAHGESVLTNVRRTFTWDSRRPK